MSELTNQPVVGTHIRVGYEPSATEQALVQRVHELEGKLAKAIAENAITCCACGRPARLRYEVEKRNADLEQQLEEARRKIANLEGDKKAIQMALESNARECNHWASQYAQERAAKEAAELSLEAAAIVFREQRAKR